LGAFFVATSAAPLHSPPKAGRIRVDIDGEGATTVDVKCAEGEPMRACADLTKEIVDKIRAAPVKQ
jgi:hypothetical protein